MTDDLTPKELAIAVKHEIEKQFYEFPEFKPFVEWVLSGIDGICEAYEADTYQITNAINQDVEKAQKSLMPIMVAGLSKIRELEKRDKAKHTVPTTPDNQTDV